MKWNMEKIILLQTKTTLHYIILKSLFLFLYHLKFHCYCTPIYIIIIIYIKANSQLQLVNDIVNRGEGGACNFKISTKFSCLHK